MAFVAGHDAGDDFAGQETDQEQLRLDGELSFDIPVGIVVGAQKIAVLP